MQYVMFRVRISEEVDIWGLMIGLKPYNILFSRLVGCTVPNTINIRKSTGYCAINFSDIYPLVVVMKVSGISIYKIGQRYNQMLLNLTMHAFFLFFSDISLYNGRRQRNKKAHISDDEDQTPYPIGCEAGSCTTIPTLSFSHACNLKSFIVFI